MAGLVTTGGTVRWIVFVAVVGSLMACSAEPRPPGADSGRALAPAPVGAAAASGSSSSDDDGCDLDSTRAHPAPLALVREFVERDARGEFAKGSEWLPGAVRCPGHLPGPDAFMAIDTMEVLTGEAVVTPDSARVPVRYSVLGEASPLHFALAGSVLLDTFVVARTAYGWRVVSPDMPMRIQAAVAAGWDDMLGDSIRTRLRAAADSARDARRP
jgi:hypothetical protein